MKNYIYFFVISLFTFICLNANAQSRMDANPSVLNSELLFNATVQIGEFSFEYSQGGNLQTFDEDQPVKMTICFMNVMPAKAEESISGEFAKYFEWSYIENINCLRGVQKELVSGDESGKISLVVKAKDKDKLESHTTIGFITNLQPAPKMNQTNKTEDDAISEYQKVSLVRNLIIAEYNKN